MKKRHAAIVACALIITVGVLALILSAVRTWQFPEPAGKYIPGLIALSVTDTTRSDPFARDHRAPREVLVWIWYPAIQAPGARPIGYVEKNPGVIGQLASMLSLPPFLFSGANQVTTHSFWEAPVVRIDTGFPVLLFSHGIGIGTVGQNISQFEHLASRGYVIVSIGHTHESCLVTFPDGRGIPADPVRWKEFLRQAKATFIQKPLPLMASAVSAQQKDSLARAYIGLVPLLYESLDVWTHDTRFVLDELDRLKAHADSSSVFSRMDLARTGIFGHSMGGMTAQQVTLDDERIVAGISYDGPPVPDVMQKGLEQPFLFMACEGLRAMNDPAIEHSKQALGMSIKGTTHFNFCDFNLWFNAAPLWRLLGLAGSIDGHRCDAIVTRCTEAFFDKYLNGRNSDLAGIVKDFPEVTLTSNPVSR